MPFSIPIFIRLALIAIGLIGGVVLWITLGPWYGVWFVLMGLTLLIGYLLLGTVQSAAELVQQMDWDGAENRLGWTLTPKLLYSTNRAYFYLLHGNIAMQKGDNQKAETFIKKSEQVGLNTSTEKAMVQFQLASIYAQKNNWTAAQLHFKNAKQHKVDEPQLKQQMDQFEQVLKQQKMAKMGKAAQRRQGMMQPGGKRRRPKMR